MIRRIEDDGSKYSLKLFEKPRGPECFTIYSDKIYVCDGWKERIAVYDLNLNYVNEITNRTNVRYILGATRIKVIFDKYCLIGNGYVTCFNNSGEVIFSNKYDFNNYYEVFIIDNKIYYYSKNNIIKSINEDGKIIDTENTMNQLKDKIGWYKGIFNHDNYINDQVINYLSNNSLIFIDDKLYYNDFSKYHNKYFKIISMIKNIKSELDELNANIFLQLIGFDKNSNSYWRIQDLIDRRTTDICVISKYGKIIAWLNNSIYDCWDENIQISENGDIYLLVLRTDGEKASYFYRIRNTWDIHENISLNTLISLHPSSITASSILTEPSDRNAYSPAKVFDGKPETGWLEGRNGPGLGDWVKISFKEPVTADTLVVSPGWFKRPLLEGQQPYYANAHHS